MTAIREALEPSVRLIGEAISDKIANLINELISKAEVISRATWDPVYQTRYAAVDKIVDSLRDEGKISDEARTEIAQLFDHAQEHLLQEISVPCDVKGDVDLNLLKGLNYFGVIYFEEQEELITFFIAPHLLPVMLRYLSVMDDESVKKHVQQIGRIVGKDYDEDELSHICYNFVFQVQKRLKSYLRKQAVSRLGEYLSPKLRMDVEFLPTSTDFYSAGIKYYDISSGLRSGTFYIFSTTTGLVLPEEHWGSVYFKEMLPCELLEKLRDKNPVRHQYFEALMKASIKRPRLYTYELQRASRQFKDTINKLEELNGPDAAKQYKADALKILECVLQIPGIGLQRITSFPPAFNHLTLGHELSVILSTRDRTGKIGSGLWIRPVKRRVFQEMLNEVRNIKYGDEVVKQILIAIGGAAAGYGIDQLFQDLNAVFWAAFAPSFLRIILKYGLAVGKQAVRAGRLLDISKYLKRKQKELSCYQYKRIGEEIASLKRSHLAEAIISELATGKCLLGS